MKRTVICILTILCIIPAKLSAQGFQVTPVTISTETVTKDGVSYRIHDVLDHQTLFSICKAYGVTLQEVIDANKELDLQTNGLKKGQKLMIPSKEEAAGQESPAVESKTPESNASENKIVVGQEYTEYTAKWYEDISMVAARFGIPKDVLMEYNGMKTETISRKQKIRIPNNPGAKTVSLAEKATAAETPSESKVENVTPEETETVAQETAPEEEPDVLGLKDAGSRFLDLFRKKKDSITVGVALPFNAKGQINDSAYDLYSGILLAARDLASQGVKSHLSVLDTRSQAAKISESWLESCDLIIGPVSPDELKNLLDKSGNDTPVISPLDPKALALAEEYSNFIQAPSNTEAQMHDLVEWIREDCGSEDKVILITEKNAAVNPIQKYLETSGISYATVSYGILESKSAVSRIEAVMTGSGTNRAVIASDNEAFVNDAVRNLNLMTYKKKDVVLYAPSKIRNFETVEVEGLHNVQAHICCSYFVDYDSDRVRNFLMTYRALFGTEPTPFAYQGYDAAYYFIRNFATSERDRDRIDRMGMRKFRGLQSDFQIEPGDTGRCGYSNHGIRRVIYGSDYSIKLAD